MPSIWLDQLWTACRARSENSETYSLALAQSVRFEQVLCVGKDCPECGGELSKLGEDATEELEYIPGRFIVTKIIRPIMACRRCEAISHAPLPSRPIERGRPRPGLLAHVLVSKAAPRYSKPKRASQAFLRRQKAKPATPAKSNSSDAGSGTGVSSDKVMLVIKTPL